MKMNFAKKATALAMSVLFAVSMAGCGSSASTAKKVEVTSVEDLADLKIGVQTGTTGDSQASDAVNADSQMQRYNKGADAIQALKNGKIDCVVIDSLPAEKFVAANDDLKIVEGIFDTEEYAMCFKKGNELRDEFNTALAELKEDGTLDEIMSNYIGDEVGQHPYESRQTWTVPTERLPWQPTLSSSRGSTKREMISLVSMPTFPRQSATSLVMS